MMNFPNTEKKLRSRISSYKSALKRESTAHGFIHDGGGKRLLLFWLYFVLDDAKKSQAYFEWYTKAFPDDGGEPVQKLCWALSLYRAGKEHEAEYQLAKAMLANLYLIPYVLGQDVQKYDMWHSSSYEFLDYIEYTPEEVVENITLLDKQWMLTLYDSSAFRRIRERYIAIFHQLQNTKGLEDRTDLLDESYALLDSLK